MISCVERASLHFCSDAAAARVANARMQPSGASHRLCEAYCQRLAGRSFPDAHVAFHDFFSAVSPAPGVGAQVELSARAAAPCEAGTPRAGCRARRRLVRAGQHGPLARCGAEFPACIMHACTPDAVLGGHADISATVCSNAWAPWCQSLSPKAVSAIPKAASAESGRQKSSEKLVRLPALDCFPKRSRMSSGASGLTMWKFFLLGSSARE